MKQSHLIEHAFMLAKEKYGELGVDVETQLEKLSRIPVSLHCWQGDDVTGFEPNDGGLTGGIQVTGNYPGCTRNPQELRADLQKMLSWLARLSISEVRKLRLLLMIPDLLTQKLKHGRHLILSIKNITAIRP
jgi:L-rhamnose isomerase